MGNSGSSFEEANSEEKAEASETFNDLILSTDKIDKRPISQNDADRIGLIPSDRLSLANRTETAGSENRVAQPTQDLRSLDQSNPAKVSKEQPSKDPISQSLASSEQTATQSGLSQEHQCFVDTESGNTGRELKFEFSPKEW